MVLFGSAATVSPRVCAIVCTLVCARARVWAHACAFGRVWARVGAYVRVPVCGVLLLMGVTPYV